MLTEFIGGFHKHFRMIALSQHLQQHGYTTSNEEHIRIPGIWNKLGRLYNLEALDERVRTGFLNRPLCDTKTTQL